MHETGKWMDWQVYRNKVGIDEEGIYRNVFGCSCSGAELIF